MSTPEEFLNRLRTGNKPPVTDAKSAFLERLRAAPVEEEDPEANPVVSFAAGVARGALDPISIVPAVSETVEKLKQYGDDDLGSKIGYGLGFVLGFAVPGAPAWRVGGMAARAARLADTANDLTRAGKLVRGATAGALLAAGRDADSWEQKAGQIAIEAAAGGIGDIVIPPMFKALSSRFGINEDKRVRDVIDEAVREGSLSATNNPEGIAAHARATALVDEIYKTKPVAGRAERPVAAAAKWNDEVFTAEPGALHSSLGARLIESGRKEDLAAFWREADMGFVTNTGRYLSRVEATELARANRQLTKDVGSDGMHVGEFNPRVAGAVKEATVDNITQPSAVSAVQASPAPPNLAPTEASVVSQLGEDVLNQTPTAAMRLAVRLGIEQLDLGSLEPGKVKIVPDVGGRELFNTLKKVEGVHVAPMNLKRPVKMPDGTYKDTTVKEILVGLEPLTPRMIQTAQKNGFIPGQEVMYGDQKWLALGRQGQKLVVGKPGAKNKTVDWDEVQFLPAAQDILGPKLKRSPSKMFAEFTAEHGLWPTQRGFYDLFEDFAKQKEVSGKARLQLKAYFINRYKEALKELDPHAYAAMETMDRESARLGKMWNPDGELDTILAQKGLTYIIRREGDKSIYEIKNDLGHIISPPLNNKQAATLWAREYGKEAGAIVKDLKTPFPDEVLPVAPAASVPPHTAGELSNFKGSALIDLFSPVLPRFATFQMFEHQLIKHMGSNFDPEVHGVWSRGMEPLQRGLALYRNESAKWLRGGKTDDGRPIKGLLKIVGGQESKHIRPDKKEVFVDFFESPRANWAAKAKELGLNDKEVQVASDLREFYNQIWERWVKDPDIQITADEFVEDYFPHFRAESDTRMRELIEIDLKRKKKMVSARTIEFMSEFGRKGILKKWEKDPFVVTANYLRSGLYKGHVKGAYDNAIGLVNKLSESNPTLYNMRNELVDYLKLVSYGSPESWASIRAAQHDIYKTLGLHVDETTQEKIINTLVTMNYGAFMAFRPGLALRNLSQTLLTTYPLLGARHTTHGIKQAFNLKNHEAIRKELLDAGAIVEGSMPVPQEDLIHAALAEGKQGIGKGAAVKAVSAARDIGHAGRRMTEIGLNVGLYNKADDINRAIAYFGQKQKVLEAANKFLNGEMDETKFFSKSGLNFYGEAVKKVYMEKLRGEGNESAARWIGAQAAHNTQWLYQLGAGPSLFSHGFGRLFGQYGTWPAWYAAYILRATNQGASSMTGADRAALLFRMAVVHKGMVVIGAAAGLNLSRWTGLSSLSWMGGPAVDWFTDLREITTRVQPSGEASAQGKMAMASYGLKDTGDVNAPANLPAFLGGRIGIDEKRPWNAMRFFGAYMPGYLAAKDFMDAANAPTAGMALAEGLNLPLLDNAGYGWPEARIPSTRMP